MSWALCLNRKIEILKRFEGYGYSIAYFILVNEQLAAEATKAALLEISKETDFFRDTLIAQQTKLKKVIMREALNVKISALPG